MGEVYRAKDTTLGREVAIKVLPAGVASTPERLQRFEREAKTVAALNHPNIVTIFGIDESDGRRFIAMELVEGKTLDRLISSGGMPLAQIFDLAVPLADALAAAHEKGIVHRDLKPANVMVTKEGRVKVLDFGLAKLTAEGQGGSSPDDVTMSAPLTGRGVVIGTVPYMSPEQLQGENLDHRTDLFSLGVMLYEMATGQRPFKGKNSATLTSSILRDPPRPVGELNSLVPRHLGRIIEHCLEKDAEHRYQSAKDVRNELRSLRKEVDSGSDFSESQPVAVPTSVSPPPSSHASAIPSGSALSAPTRRGEFWVGVGVLAVVILIAAFWVGSGGNTPEGTVASKPALNGQAADGVSSIRSIAVIPFESVGGGATQDYFIDGITGAITDDLAKISALKVTNARTMMHYKGSDSPLPQIAREVAVDAFVTGDALQVGDRIQIRVRLVEATTQRQIWSDHFERDKRDILKVYNEVARAVAERVKIELTPDEKRRLTAAPKVNWNAYDVYARGQELVRRGTRQSCHEAIGLFDAALAIDPRFAQAHAAKANAYRTLASTHVSPRETMPEMEKAARAALALDDGLVEAHIALGQYLMRYQWEWTAAELEFQRALELNPSHGEARLAYADWLAAMKRGDEALAQLNMSVELDPAVKYTDASFHGVAFMTRRFDRCIRNAMDVLNVDPDNWRAHEWAGLAQSQLGHHQDAIRHLRRAVALSEEAPQIRAMLGGVLAVAKHSDEARRIRKQLKKRKHIEYVCPYEVATISIGLEEYDQAFDEISEACDDRAECIPWIQADPRLDPIRDDPRFDEVLTRVGFEPSHPPPLTVETARRLAVLPFANDSGDRDADFLCDGIAESVINSLIAIPELRVISRNTAFRHRGRENELDEVARDLNVRTVLTGRVQKWGNRLVVSVALEDIESGQQLWGDRFDREITDILTLEREISEKITDALRLTVNRAKRGEPDTEDPEARLAYMQGRFWWNKRTSLGFGKSLEQFDRAIELDPDYALAYAGKATTYAVLGMYTHSPLEVIPLAKRSAEKAIELDPTLAEAYAPLGWIQGMYERKWAAAERTFLKSIELNSRYETAHHWYGFMLACLGRFDESESEFKKAQSLDPGSFVINRDYALPALLRRNFAVAERRMRHTVELYPNNVTARLWLSSIHVPSRRFKEAIAYYREASALDNSTFTAGLLGYALGLEGRRSEALKDLSRLEAVSKVQYVPAATFALIHAGLGDLDRAFEYFDKALIEQCGFLPMFKFDPTYDPLRHDPRFDRLLERIGFPSDPPAPVVESWKPKPASLAVLPFENISSDLDTEYLSNEIPANIIDKLSRLSGLSVISRSGAFRFDPAKEDASSFGRGLGASVVLTGQLNVRGNHLTIRAELVDVATNQQLWSKRYPRELSDIMAVEADITESISEALRLELTPEERTELAKDHTNNAEAYRSLLEGRFWFQKFTLAGWRRALGHFQDAVRIDPKYAVGHAELGKVLGALGVWFGDMPPDEAGPKAKQAAVTAIALDDTLGEAHGVLALHRFFYDWDWAGAEESFLRSISLSPESAEVHMQYAILLRVTGRLREAEEVLKVAEQLDPTLPVSLTELAETYAYMGRYREGIEQCKQALVLDPAFPPAFQALGYLFLAKRMYDEAISHFEKNSSLRNHQTDDLGSLGSAYALAGKRNKALAVLNELRGVSSKGRGQYAAAKVYACLGNVDAAFASLEQAFRQRDPGLLWLNTHLQFASLRDDPRYVDLARRMGFEPDSKSSSTAKDENKKTMLAVLPFANLSGDPEQEYFSDGMTEEMITRLGRLRPALLGVIARTSAMRYKNTNKSIDAIGDELGVAYVVEGGVRRAGSSVRINAQLIQVSDQTQLWGDSYTRDLSDVFAVQAEVAEAVAKALAVELLPQHVTASAKKPTDSAAAHNAYLLGRSYWAKRTPESLYAAIEHFKRAVELDPYYALAYSGLADTWGVLPYYVPGAYGKINAEAKKVAEEALALDDSLAETHASMALILGERGNWKAANEHYRKATAIDPNYATAHQWYGQSLANQRRFDEAALELEKAITLDPLSAVMRISYGGAMRLARRWDVAIEQLTKAIDLQPNLAGAANELTFAYLGKDDHAAAAASFENCLTVLGQSPSLIARFRRTYETAGIKVALVEWLELFRDEDSLPRGAAAHAESLAWCGEKDRAFEWLERAVQQQDPLVLNVETNHAYDKLRDDPRYTRLVKRIANEHQEDNPQGSP